MVSSSREPFTGKLLCFIQAHGAKGRIQVGSCSSKIVGDQYNPVHTGAVRAAEPQFCGQYNTLPSFLGFPPVINQTAKTLIQPFGPDKELLAGFCSSSSTVLVSLGAVVLNYCSASPVRCITVI